MRAPLRPPSRTYQERWAREVLEEVGVMEVVLGRVAGYDPLRMRLLARRFTFEELARVYVLSLADSEYAWSTYEHLIDGGSEV